MSMTRRTSKEQLRIRFRAYRDRLSYARYEPLSRAITELANGLETLKQAETIHVYWPLVDRREVDTRPLISAFRHRGKRIVLPRVLDTSNDAAPRMEHVQLDSEAALRQNAWGLHEPVGTNLVPPDALDAVIVPCLGASHDGHRLGYGGGFYDTFLRGLHIPRICLTYEACLVSAIPTEAHDVAMTHIITERRVKIIEQAPKAM